jgi:hypothetical protein
MSIVRRIRARAGVSLLLLLAVVACDDGPSGPGYLEGTLEGPLPAGSVFLAVTGSGIEGFDGAAGSHVFAHEVAGENSTRVVVVAPADDGPLRFRVEVLDRAATPPVAAIVELFGRDDRRISNTGPYRVTFRP